MKRRMGQAMSDHRADRAGLSNATAWQITALWAAVVLGAGAAELRAGSFEGPEPAASSVAGTTSVLARQPQWADGEAGWPTGAALPGAPAPETVWSDGGAEGEFMITDGASGMGCSGCGGNGCEACCPAGGMGDSPGFFNRIFGAACPRWVVQVDALMLWQGNIPSRPLFAAGGIGAVGPTLLDANQAQTAMSAGPRVALFLNLDEVYAIEGNYFQVRPFNGEALVPPGNTLVQQNLAGFSSGGFDGAQVLTNGAIQSAELNWRRRECWCPVTWLAGFRWVQWNQQMRIIEHAAGSPSGSFTSATGNDLYGGQIGMDLGLWNSGGPFTVIGTGKAGVFYNNAFQRTSYQQPGLTPSASAVADQTAFFGELGVNGSLRLTDWLSWRVGYVLFWLNGVALPADQLSTTNLNDVTAPVGATINTNGSVLLHGATTGLEARW